MTRIQRVLLVLLGSGTIALLGFAYFLRNAPVSATGWVAKRVCSGVFVGGRAPETLEEATLPLPVPLPIEIPAEIDYVAKTVTAHFASYFAPSTARFRPGLGCTLEGPKEASSPLDEVILPQRARARPFRVEPSAKIEEAITDAFAEADGGAMTSDFLQPKTRAVVVLRDGVLVAERYAEGFDAATALPGWSMTKSVTSTLIGLLVSAGRIDLAAPVGLEEWAGEGDSRSAITWDQLLRMSSGLAFEEDYGAPNSDAIQMLFGIERFSRGRYAALRSLVFEPDTAWSYSSGTTNLLHYAMLTQVFHGDAESYLRYPAQALFDPLGMSSAIIEPDESGVYVGSSHQLATARDWARLGQLYLDRGEFEGNRLLPETWIDYALRPTATNTAGTYGAHWWLNVDPAEGVRRFPRLASNVFMASGFEGQYVVVVPNDGLVIVRLGLDRGDRLDIEGLVARVVAAARGSS